MRAIIRDEDHQYANVEDEAMEAYDGGNVADYDVACTETGDSGEYVVVFPSWLTVGKNYTLQFIPIDDVETPIVEADLPNRFSVACLHWDGTNLFPDWAIKLVESASPVTNSPEAKIAATKTAAEAVDTLTRAAFEEV